MLAGMLLVLALLLQDVAVPGFAGTWKVRPDQLVDPQAAVDSSAGSGQVKGGGLEWYLIPRANWKGEVERLELRQMMIDLLAETNTIELVLAPGEVRFYSGELSRILYLAREHTREDRRGRRLQTHSTLTDAQLTIVSDWADGMKVTESYTLLPSGSEMLATLKWESKYLIKPFELARRYQRSAP